MMDPRIKAAREAPACAKHTGKWSAAYWADVGEYDACAQSVADRVAIAMREGGWVRAVPTAFLTDVCNGNDGDVRRAIEICRAELHRRAKEETT